MNFHFQNNLIEYPYPSQRRVILGNQGAVATSQPLATLAGMEMFWAGGNAVDAAIATAIALTVVEPTSNGIGGDAFALVWDGKLHGLNGSGKSPSNLPLEKYKNLTQVPQYGWLSVTVPGVVAAWHSLWQRWGKLPFAQLFNPAIRYAQQGFPVSPVTAQTWQLAAKNYLSLKDKEFKPFQQLFFPRQQAPGVGETWSSLAHSQTLQEIANTEGESFYRGRLAQAIANFAKATGGFITETDLANHRSEWIQPISSQYRGLTVWEIPPHTQGIAALMALNILGELELNANRETGIVYHQQIEAMKLAFADLYAQVGDARFMKLSPPDLLSKTYAAQRKKLITSQAMTRVLPGLPQGGTVYLATADENLMVSLIQSNYEAFGSGILIPDTGIALHNRGAGFSLQVGHPNQLVANKYPLHTIIPGFLTQGNTPIGAFGVMGAPMQPQGHLQVVSNLVDYGMNPQSALDAPRWRVRQDGSVLVESTVKPKIIADLKARGHEVEIAPPRMFGKGQIVFRSDKTIIAASEPRADGLALAF
ncbi:MAG: gamma-glutamyltransferase family protein [Cyanobacteria bacterium J083]|nr:MAG: gamma-glutamyltransferase family protein [Cyanobacteria bacterium J083]